MPPIPEARIDSLKAAADILELCRSYGMKLERRGGDHFALCPFHEDKTASLSLTPGKNLFHCFGCGEKGNIYQLVQKLESVPFPEAFSKIEASLGVKGRDLKLIPRNTPKAEAAAPGAAAPSPAEASARLEEVFKAYEKAFAETPAALTYLSRERGLSSFASKRLGVEPRVGFCPESASSLYNRDTDHLLGLLDEAGRPHFRNCLVFPLKDEDGLLKGFYGRRLPERGEKGPAALVKHVYQKGAREGVFGFFKEGEEEAVLVESVLDALTLFEIGVPSALALHGVNGFTRVHEAWLKARGIRRVALALDGDKAGREAAPKIKALLEGKGFKAFEVLLPEGHDPNSYFTQTEMRTKAALKALPGYVDDTPPPPKLNRSETRLEIAFPRSLYAVPLPFEAAPGKLRVVLRLCRTTSPERFHLDTVDLYSSRARESFAEAAGEALGMEPLSVEADLKTLIPLLEAERDKKGMEEEGQKALLSEKEKEDALTLLRNKNLIKNLLSSFEALGMIGEENAKLLGYLGTVSRLIPQPLGMLIISRSGAGKTALQDAICQLVPEEDLVKYTRLSGQALFYKEREGLKHKVLAIEEEDGMRQALYSIRTLASSQRLCVATTRSDPKTGKLKTDEYLVEGPVFILIATTNPDALDAETRSRFIILTIDESEAQTRRIIEARKAAYTLEGRRAARERQAELKKLRDMQRLLRPLEVVNPFVPFLDYPFDRLQMRREFSKYMGLLNSIALLHQHQREVKVMEAAGERVEYVEVHLEDLELAGRLAGAFFLNSLDEKAPHTRALLKEVVTLLKKKKGDGVRFTRKELRDSCRWTDWSIRQGLEQLLELGYVGKAAGKNGVTIHYELLCEEGEEGASFFKVDLEEVKRRMRAAKEK